MDHPVSIDAHGRDRYTVRLEGSLLGHVVRDPHARTEVWLWWSEADSVPQQREDTHEMAVYRLLLGAGLEFPVARTLAQRGAGLGAA